MPKQDTAPSLKLTEDGSLTLYSPHTGEHYHSTHGAVQESMHIYIGLGLRHYLQTHPQCREVHILELGFGTGLNALLSYATALEMGVRIHYTSLELYPLDESIYSQLHYTIAHHPDLPQGLLTSLHRSPWGNTVELDEHFALHKQQIDLRDYRPDMGLFDVVYFDAFSPESQPELWSEAVFSSIAQGCHLGSVLTTYCAKGVIRRLMQSVGYTVERLAGPPGKREVLRGTML